MCKLFQVGLVAVLSSAASVALAGHPNGGGKMGHPGRSHFDGHRGFDGVPFGFENGVGLWGFGCGGGWGYDCYSNDERIPFYAIHPPVYYSRIVPRAMGWTPFAYSPDAIVLPLDDGGPQQIINPYVQPKSEPVPAPAPSVKAKPSSDKTASDSESIKVILNPFVGSELASRVD